jgi:membrane protease YdiL (CAAX protease family)
MAEKKKLNTVVLVFLIVMTLVSFANLIRIEFDGSLLKLAGLVVIIGVVAFFVTRKTNDSKDEGLNIKTCLNQIKNRKIIILMLIPVIFDVLTVFVEKAFFPDVLAHSLARLPFEMDPSKIIPIIIELLILPLGEEIALRGFYQKQAAKLIGFVPALVIASFIFAVGHFSYGSPVVVIMDLVGVFIDSLIFGIIFKETDNAWCSWISHSLADIVAVIVMMMIV